MRGHDYVGEQACADGVLAYVVRRAR
jgi:hypothetical protein